MLVNLVIAGGRFAPLGATNVNPPESVAVCPADITTTSAGPPVGRAAIVAVSVVGLWTAISVAAIPATISVVSLPNSAPATVTGVPPVVLPDGGRTETIRSGFIVGFIGDFFPLQPAAMTATTREAANG